jgi:UTP-glucose-1-phosphate uridylyltransferase
MRQTGRPHIRKAVFPVGGLGTRFWPFSRTVPKEMLPVNQKPLIHYAVEEAMSAGIDQLIFVTSRGKAIIEDYFDYCSELSFRLAETGYDGEEWLPEPGHIYFTRQQEPLGLGHAVWCARHIVGDEPFAVLLADEFFPSPTNGQQTLMQQMVSQYQDSQVSIIAAQEVPIEQSVRYGMIEGIPHSSLPNCGHIKKIVEKPDPQLSPSNLSVIGRYILSPNIFSHLEKMAHQPRNGEIQLTGALNNMLAKEGALSLKYHEKRFDCGSQNGFVAANIAMQNNDLSS